MNRASLASETARNIASASSNRSSFSRAIPRLNRASREALSDLRAASKSARARCVSPARSCATPRRLAASEVDPPLLLTVGSD